MSLKGNLKSISLAEIIQLIGLGEKTGCLKIQSNEDTAYIFFEKGLLTYAYLKSSPLSLEKILITKKVLSQDKLKKLFDYAREKNLNPIKVLDTGKILSKEKTLSLIRNAILNVVFDIFKWKEGEFEFEDDSLPENPIIKISENFNNIIMECSRRVDEIELVKKTIPTDKTPLLLSNNAIDRIPSLKLSDMERNILKYFNKITNVYEISKHFNNIDEFDLYKFVYGFVQSKIVMVLQEENYETIMEHVDLATFYLERENYDDALKEAERAILLAPFDENIINLLKVASRGKEINERVIEFLKNVLKLKEFILYKEDTINFIMEITTTKSKEKPTPVEILKRATEFVKKGDFKNAIDILTKYGEIKNKNYYLLLGNCYVKTNNLQKAYEAYEGYLQFDPENAKIKKLIEILKQRI